LQLECRFFTKSSPQRWSGVGNKIHHKSGSNTMSVQSNPWCLDSLYWIAITCLIESWQEFQGCNKKFGLFFQLGIWPVMITILILIMVSIDCFRPFSHTYTSTYG
jgi:hypothetical protein